MGISLTYYPSFTYLDYNSGTEKTYFGTQADALYFQFGESHNVYTSRGFKDDDFDLNFDVCALVSHMINYIDGAKKLWKMTSFGNINQGATFNTIIRLFPKKVTSVSGANIRINVSLTCRAYADDKTTQVEYFSTYHKWTNMSIILSADLYSGNSNIFSSSYTPYNDDIWYEGEFNPPYSDSYTYLNKVLSANNANFCIHPYYELRDLSDSTSITNYVNSVDNFIFVYKRLSYSDTRYNVDVIYNISTSAFKTWLTAMLNANIYNIADIPPNVDDEPVGNRDDTSDFIPIGELPSINTFASGLITAYHVNTSDLATLSDFLWDDNFIETIPKLVANPMDAVICLKSFPINLTSYGAASTIKIGGIDTEISADRLTQQYILIDCGSINLHEYYGDFTDYDNTTVLISLPYVGEHVLPTDEVLESTLHLYYKVDLFTGSCMAQIEILKNRFNTVLQGAIYSFKGNLACEYPLTGQMYGNIINALSGLFTTNVAMALNSANSLINGERKIEINGNHSENFGALGTQTPYIKLVTAIQNNPDSYNINLGAYANRTSSIGSLKGYTEISAANLSIAGATESEIEEIKSLLYNGVIIY